MIMAQSVALIATLKKALKAHGKTYADVARQLALTEASVKRLFSEQSFSLQRLDQVCQMMGMEISDLVQMMREETQRQISQLTEDQEQEIVSDLELLLVTLCVLNRWALEDILAHYHIPETRCIRKLAQLDRLRLIELLPKNRIKLRIAPNFNWRDNGPIQRFFQQQVAADFLSGRLDPDTDRLIFVNGMLSASSRVVFHRKLERLAREFDELNNDDAGLPIVEKRWNSVVLAIRQWEVGPFGAFKKP
jgi:DNA-binding Xre family transcriptional regulator